MEKLSPKLIVFGRDAGTVVGDALVTRRDSARHFFYKWGGYSLSIAAINLARERGAKKVIIDILDRSETIEAPFEEFFEHGIDWLDGTEDNQKVLPLKYFRLIKKKDFIRETAKMETCPRCEGTGKSPVLWEEKV